MSTPVLLSETARDQTCTLLHDSTTQLMQYLAHMQQSRSSTQPRRPYRGLQQSNPSSGSCSQWWMESTNISCVELHREDLKIHSIAPLVHLNSTQPSKLLALWMFHPVAESITLLLVKTQCLTDGRDCSGSNFLPIRGYYFHYCTAAYGFELFRFFIILQRPELCGPSASSPRTRACMVAGR